MSLKLIGAGLSPFVRKVRVILAEKGIAYEHDPVIPFTLDDDYRKLHPLKKIPVLVDGDRPIPDSSAIAAFLERKQPEPALFPKDDDDYVRAIWLEEFGDGGLVPLCTVPFAQRIVQKVFMGQEPDEEAIEKAVKQDLPPLLDYLEDAIGDREYLVGGRFSIADIAVASPFINMAHGGEAIDPARWPKTTAYLDRIHSRPSFKALIEEEKAGIPG